MMKMRRGFAIAGMLLLLVQGILGHQALSPWEDYYMRGSASKLDSSYSSSIPAPQALLHGLGVADLTPSQRTQYQTTGLLTSTTPELAAESIPLALEGETPFDFVANVTRVRTASKVRMLNFFSCPSGPTTIAQENPPPQSSARFQSLSNADEIRENIHQVEKVQGEVDQQQQAISQTQTTILQLQTQLKNQRDTLDQKKQDLQKNKKYLSRKLREFDQKLGNGLFARCFSFPLRATSSFSTGSRRQTKQTLEERRLEEKAEAPLVAAASIETARRNRRVEFLFCL